MINLTGFLPLYEFILHSIFYPVTITGRIKLQTVGNPVTSVNHLTPKWILGNSPSEMWKQRRTIMLGSQLIKQRPLYARK